MPDVEHTNFTYVDTDEGMAEVLPALERAPSIAIDIEADSLHHYFEKVCLIQITIEEENYIVDPLTDMDLDPFLQVLAHKTLILHDAGYDLRMLKNSFGFETKAPVFDTMLAAQLLGYKRLGLVALIKHFCGVSLSKHGQKSDWSRRPLTPNQLQYASDDTYYLHVLAEKLHNQLEQLGRLEWHDQACKKMVRSATAEKEPPDPDRIWRIKGTSKLDPLRLTLVKHIWHWRNDEARKADRPAFHFMHNKDILKLADWVASHPHASIRKSGLLPDNCRGSRRAALENAVHQALSTPPDQMVAKQKRKKSAPAIPYCQQIIEDLRERTRKKGEQLNLPPQIIASRATLTHIGRDRISDFDRLVEEVGMLPWQADILLPDIKETLAKYPKK
ncbi:Ribonuclease D [Anaerohalosphaera lusitana]|uniref:Ribonuclease D n=1 Tax=Anaerohalosphaera lusitana TaxID=1936003 RepID=A0A1U9NQV7_9BACT|nr:ribonuclease D [Anaerohalosphaera lusitana]AQT70000.1 Ribonuclease D [Anaerohalosphaera lusitana]